MDEDAVVAEAVNALVHGPGYYVVPNALQPAEIEELNAIINEHTKNDNKVGATLHGSEYNQKKLIYQRGGTCLTRNLLRAGAASHCDESLCQNFGKNFILGSFAANTLLPGAPGQSLMWTIRIGTCAARRSSLWASIQFHMNCQSLFTLQDFTMENGATALVPYSQKRGIYQRNYSGKSLCKGMPAGSLVLFTGMLWHCAMPNNSQEIRTSLLGQYLPKFVKPMEDLINSVAPEVIAQGTPQMQQLINGSEVP